MSYILSILYLSILPLPFPLPSTMSPAFNNVPTPRLAPSTPQTLLTLRLTPFSHPFPHLLK